MKTYTQHINFNNPDVANYIYEHTIDEKGLEQQRKLIHTSWNIETSNIKYFELLKTRNHYTESGVKVVK